MLCAIVFLISLATKSVNNIAITGSNSYLLQYSGKRPNRVLVRNEIPAIVLQI
jgi:hypothetical protein